MLPDPLHAAIVHLPVAFAILVPLLALLGIQAIRRDFLPIRAWTAVVLVQALLVGSAYLAVETGENEEERVEKVVAESRIEAHEDAAKRLLWIAVVTFAVSATGLLGGLHGTLGRGATLVLSLAVFAAALSTGRLGGELVYRYGAASAYGVERAASGQVDRGTEARHHDEDEDDD